MDDYPRASPSKFEVHLDLMSWMIFSANILKEIGSLIQKDPSIYLDSLSKWKVQLDGLSSELLVLTPSRDPLES